MLLFELSYIYDAYEVARVNYYLIKVYNTVYIKILISQVASSISLKNIHMNYATDLSIIPFEI